MLNSTFCKYPFNMSASAIYGSICKNTWVERPRIRTTQSDYSVNMQKPYGKMWDSLCFCLLPKWSKKPLFFLRQFCVKIAQVERNLNAIWTQSERNPNAFRFFTSTAWIFMSNYGSPKSGKKHPPKKKRRFRVESMKPKSFTNPNGEKQWKTHLGVYWVSCGNVPLQFKAICLYLPFTAVLEQFGWSIKAWSIVFKHLKAFSSHPESLLWWEMLASKWVVFPGGDCHANTWCKGVAWPLPMYSILDPGKYIQGCFHQKTLQGVQFPQSPRQERDSWSCQQRPSDMSWAGGNHMQWIYINWGGKWTPFVVQMLKSFHFDPLDVNSDRYNISNRNHEWSIW